jgi:hypothetical protein
MKKITELNSKEDNSLIVDMSDPTVATAVRDLIQMAPKLTSIIEEMIEEIKKKKSENENI